MKQDSLLSHKTSQSWHYALASLVALALLSWNIAMAGSTATVAATVTAQLLNISVAPGTIAYGSVPLNTATTTVNHGYQQTVTNSGSTIQLNVKSSDATNGTSWTLASSPGSDTYEHQVSTTTGSTYMIMPNSSTYITASSTMTTGVTNTQKLDFQLTTPTASTDFLQKSITITVQAAAI
ncbi:MAG: hypothetical protein ABSF56_02700 [Minisyncoccia bacterium]|jgi:hypothetical protein